MTKTMLEGHALIRAAVKNCGTSKIVSTLIAVEADYTADWQYDAYCWHDEGWFDYDIREAGVVYPDEYIEIKLDGTTVEGDSEITKILEVLEYDLNEV